MTHGDDPFVDVIGKEEVYEAFAELLIPLAEDLALAERLTLEIGGRYSKYSHAGGVDTYKAGLEWVPVEGLNVRTSYNFV